MKSIVLYNLTKFQAYLIFTAFVYGVVNTLNVPKLNNMIDQPVFSSVIDSFVKNNIIDWICLTAQKSTPTL